MAKVHHPFHLNGYHKPSYFLLSTLYYCVQSSPSMISLNGFKKRLLPNQPNKRNSNMAEFEGYGCSLQQIIAHPLELVPYEKRFGPTTFRKKIANSLLSELIFSFLTCTCKF